ncbi:integrase arm-type DNA-binding domain-containing protein [Henriciella sp.]|uniref:tyrosine-type recombinase/integrase n=1 Tax=Henriciella sp. TaxID=1968823 RepID=UPI0026271960|nr:integrase arm-type DNA-binding domain-containing protein [Henriciella sp.]
MARLREELIAGLAPRMKPYKCADGCGLYIYITPKGSRLWRMNYRFEHRQKTLSFGAWPIVTLEHARGLCLKAKRLLHKGLDPAVDARPGRKPPRRRALTGTFDTIADELLDKREREGLAGVTLHKKRWLLDFARPGLGHKQMRDIHAADILDVLKQVEARGTYETAKRLRTTVGEVFRYAIATLRADIDPTQALRGALTRPQVRHMPALTEEAGFARLVRAVWGYEGSARSVPALKLMILLFPRPGELRLARWEEFDFDRSAWEIPAERMKMRRPHRKPLSGTAVNILLDIRAGGCREGFVFPSMVAADRPISENTMNGALHRLGFASDVTTPHGFRASASSLLNESGLWNPDAIEAELAHHDTKGVRSIYNRAVYWNERARMGDWWADRVLAMTNYESRK